MPGVVPLHGYASVETITTPAPAVLPGGRADRGVSCGYRRSSTVGGDVAGLILHVLHCISVTISHLEDRNKLFSSRKDGDTG